MNAHSVVDTLPEWVPLKVRDYCAHVLDGHSLRHVAERREGHASTVMRHVKAIEDLRDDPLIDRALSRLDPHLKSRTAKGGQMLQDIAEQKLPDEEEVNREGRRVLRRLAETDAFLVLADHLDTAVVMRPQKDGPAVKTAVVAQNIAQAFALRDWISCLSRGRIARYEISHAGKKALKRMLAEDDLGDNAFQAQHKDWSERKVSETGGRTRRLRVNLAESPLTALGRRKDSGGQPFLSPELIAAGERLREDFETAQMGPKITQNWERFLTGGRGGAFSGDNNAAEGPMAARARVSAALKDLGPGLGDIALRCCCFLEGMEAAERRMGWSARSGKIVLRIALQRLRLHYDGKGRQTG